MDKDGAIFTSDVLVIGAGFAGATIARELAERGDRKVAVLERRPHIGGNAYDHLDSQGVLIHAYGPHIYHTGSKRVHDYLSRFTEWYGYQHEVLANVHGSHIPVPFNLNSIQASFEPEVASAYTQALLQAYSLGSRVGILDLKEQPDPLLRELAEYVYQNVFLHYTMKQWGLTPEQIDPAVTARVPVLVGYDNRYFQDQYQGMPSQGYTALFEAMLGHPNISLHLGVDASDVLGLQIAAAPAAAPDQPAAPAAAPDQPAAPAAAPDQPAATPPRESVLSLQVGGKPYDGLVIYTGALDELTGWRYGILPYRSLDFTYRRYARRRVQPAGTVNFTVSEDYTRTTEYTWLTGQDIDVTTVAEEYPRAFTDPATQIPYYPVSTAEATAAYQRYAELFDGLPRFIALGRLAEYRYYNIDQIVSRALDLADDLLS